MRCTRNNFIITVLSLVICTEGAFPSSMAIAQTRPAITTNVDDPSRVPYQASVRQFCFIANAACDFTFPAVPSGKRLVITHASGYFSSGATDSTQFVFVSLRKGGNDDMFLPTSFQGCGSALPVQCPQSIFVFNETIQVYYNAGDAPVVRIATGNRAYPLVGSVSGSPLPINNTVTLTGYLIDCTTVPCQPIAP